MRHNDYRWTVMMLLVAGLLFSACNQTPAARERIVPARVEKIEGTDLKRVVLTEKAVRRLDLQTAPLREEQVVRTRTVGGEVVAPPAGKSIGGGKAWVRVLLTESDLSQVDRGQPALIQLLDDDEEDGDGATGLLAEDDEEPDLDEPEDEDLAEAALYYVVDDADNSLVLGQRVFVELTLTGGGTPRKIIPYAAVIYDPQGATWVYTNPEQLAFVRQPIVVDYVEDELAVLSDGPAAGTEIVTTGGAELFGAETGVSK